MVRLRRGGLDEPEPSPLDLTLRLGGGVPAEGEQRDCREQRCNQEDAYGWPAAHAGGLPGGSSDADYALTARGEYRFIGDKWSAFKQFTSFRGSPFAAMAGAAVHYQSGGETFNTTDEDLAGLTADLSLLGDGFNAFAAVLWQRVEPAGGPQLENTGLIVQGGWFVDPAWELFARWDAVLSNQVDDFSTVTVGVNRYLLPDSHAVKFTGDVQFFLDEQASTDAPASTATGLQASTRDGQWALRLQVQLLF